MKLTGIFPALVTPFDKAGKINEKSLEKLIKMNLEKGVDGFYVGGSTAEAFLLSLEERKYILDIVMQCGKAKSIIISHVGCIGTEHAIELAKYAKKLGVDLISAIPPFYYKFSFEEIKNYYFDIVNTTDLPMIVYNFPSLSGIDLSSDKIKTLTENKRIVGIKHTSHNLFQIERMRNENNNLIILNGLDEVFFAGLVMGADGGIGSTYNFMSEKFIKIRKLFKQGNLADAMQMQKQVNEIIDVLAKTGLQQGIKYILTQMGIDCGLCRKPFAELDSEKMTMLDTLITDNQ